MKLRRAYGYAATAFTRNSNTHSSYTARRASHLAPLWTTVTFWVSLALEREPLSPSAQASAHRRTQHVTQSKSTSSLEAPSTSRKTEPVTTSGASRGTAAHADVIWASPVSSIAAA